MIDFVNKFLFIYYCFDDANPQSRPPPHPSRNQLLRRHRHRGPPQAPILLPQRPVERESARNGGTRAHARGLRRAADPMELAGRAPGQS